MIAAALCLIFLLLLPGCGLPDATAPLPTGELVSAPGVSAAQPTVSPTAEVASPTGESSPLAFAQGLVGWFSQHLGRTGLLLAFLAVVIVLLAIVVIILVRVLTRGSKSAQTVPAPATSQGGPPTGGGTTRPLGDVHAGAVLVLQATSGEVPSGDPSTFTLDAAGATIGRGPDSDLVIDEAVPGADTVSRHHARISLDDGHWIVEDLDSQNGIYVNGRRTGRNLLQDGWTLAIGGVQFIFHNGTGREAQ